MPFIAVPRKFAAIGGHLVCLVAKPPLLKNKRKSHFLEAKIGQILYNIFPNDHWMAKPDLRLSSAADEVANQSPSQDIQWQIFWMRLTLRFAILISWY